MIKSSSYHLRMAWYCFQKCCFCHILVLQYIFSWLLAPAIAFTPFILFFMGSHWYRSDLTRAWGFKAWSFREKGMIFHDFQEKLAWLHECFPKIQSGPQKLINKMLSKKVYGRSNTLIHGFCLPFSAKQGVP